MLKIKKMRPAIAMLELIFAIVIMGIILMSAPQLISTATKSGYVAIQQEAINEAASQVNMIMGYYWDENDANESYLDPILETNGDSDLNEEGTTGRRLGTPQESYRTFVRSDGQRLSASALGVDAGDTTGEDDIDDFTGVANLIEIESAIADTVEKSTININRTISYSTDSTNEANYNLQEITYDPFTTSGGTTTNIKSITVTVTSSSGQDELEKEITLRAFSCNIGGYKLEERNF